MDLDVKPIEINDDEPENKLSAEEETQNRLETLLSQVETGWKISVHRRYPHWCRGYLETVEIYDPGEPLDIDALVRQWGGQCLLIKVHNEHGKWIGCGTIPLYGYKPRMHGIEVSQEDYAGTRPITPSRHPVYSEQANSNLNGGQLDLQAIVKLLSSNKKEENSFAMKMLERFAMQPPQPPPPPQQNILSDTKQMIEMFQLMKQMQGLFGGSNNADNSDNSDNGLGPIFGDVIKSLVSKQDQKPSPQRRKPVVVPPRDINAYQNNTQPAPRSPVEGSTMNIDDFAKQLSALDAEDAAQVALEAFGNMPAKKREQAMTAFFGAFNEDEELDETLDSTDNFPNSDDQDDDEKEFSH